MAVCVAFTLCVLVGASVAYNGGLAPYYVGPNDPYAVEINSNYIQEPYQRLFWNKYGNNGSGSNQVGGTGLWAMLTNKFPILNNMFGRMEMVPLSSQYGPPQYQQPNYYQQPGFNPRVYYPQYVPSNPGRNVAVTDDAVIVTPPHVPVFQPAPPAAQPAPPVAAPAPVPEPEPAPQEGYQYNRPQYRFELPHK